MRMLKAHERPIDDLLQIAGGFVGGMDACWGDLYEPGSVRKCSLPTLPFRESSFWLEKNEVTGQAGSNEKSSQGFVRHETLDTAGLPFRDHVVGGRKLLPGAWIVQSILDSAEGNGLVIRQLRFLNALPAHDKTVPLQLVLGEDEQFEYTSEQSVLAQGQILHGSSLEKVSAPDGGPFNVTKQLDEGDVYEHLSRRGYDYGESLRLVTCFAGDGEKATASLKSSGAALYQIIDAAIQVALVLDGSSDRLLLAGIDEVFVCDGFMDTIAKGFQDHHHCLKVSVQRLADIRTGRRFNIQVFLPDGQLGVGLSGVNGQVKPSDQIEDVFYVPHWTPQEVSCRPSSAGGTIIFYPEGFARIARCVEEMVTGPCVFVQITEGASDEFQNSDLDQYEVSTKETTIFDQVLQRISERLGEALEEVGGRIVFIGLNTDEDVSSAAITASQGRGVVMLSRLLQRLVRGGSLFRLEQLVVLTNRTCRVHEEEDVQPLGADLHGLASNAERELIGLRSHIIDLDFDGNADWFNKNKKVLGPLVNAEAKGETAIRGGVVHRRGLRPLRLPQNPTSVFKHRGAYVVLGGAGGIGLALCEHLLSHYEARVLLIGRSELNDELGNELRRLEKIGGEVIYAQGDASHADSIRKAVMVGKKRFGAINGAMHSALVLADKTLENMDESNLLAVLAPKTVGCLNFVNALADEKMDFLALFSSMLSFTSNAGQSNYAAACRFEDAFGAHMQLHSKYPVMVVNWGYWSEIGVVAEDRYARKLANRGILGFKTKEGLTALERVLSSRKAQVLVLRALPRFLNELGVDGVPIQWEPITREVLLAMRAYPPRISRFLTSRETSEEMLKRVPQIFSGDVVPRYQRFHEIIGKVIEAARAPSNINDIPPEGSPVRQYPEMKGYIQLLEQCLDSMREILTGKLSVTDVIFPNASLELVSGVYASNRIADFFNDKLAEMAKEIVVAKRGYATGSVRIIEIGAGTGGTTASVLKALEPLGKWVEYVYTDVSTHFLEHGAQRFKSATGLTFCLLDIEKRAETQSIQPGSFDLVIASNVLHATSDIKQTLMNVKSLLRHDGVTLINEVSSIHLITTLTFGLLPGWWRHSDPEMRLPNSPLLSPTLWYKALQSVGFENIMRFGQEGRSESVVQDIYLAMSNGEVAPMVEGNVAMTEHAGNAKDLVEPLSMNDSKELEEVVIDSLVESLRLDREVFDRKIPFTEFGIDSITAVEVINCLNKRCGTTLRSTDIFNYPDIPALAARLADLNVSVLSANGNQAHDQLEKSRVENDPLLAHLNRLASGEVSVAETERVMNGIKR
jgi:SAM-dependent methyltransferase/NADP-dependent 3-hydroxy acid dehydrogenase YdfG